MFWNNDIHHCSLKTWTNICHSIEFWSTLYEWCERNDMNTNIFLNKLVIWVSWVLFFLHILILFLYCSKYSQLKPCNMLCSNLLLWKHITDLCRIFYQHTVLIKKIFVCIVDSLLYYTRWPGQWWPSSRCLTSGFCSCMSNIHLSIAYNYG